MGEELMNMQKLPGSRALLIAVLLMGLLLVPVAMADVPGALSYGIKGISGAALTQPAYHTGSGQYMLGSISAYGIVNSQTPSSHFTYSTVVSASGKITNFAFTFNYEG
jgi:hypothetical protein